MTECIRIGIIPELSAQLHPDKRAAIVQLSSQVHDLWMVLADHAEVPLKVIPLASPDELAGQAAAAESDVLAALNPKPAGKPGSKPAKKSKPTSKSGKRGGSAEMAGAADVVAAWWKAVPAMPGVVAFLDSEAGAACASVLEALPVQLWASISSAEPSSPAELTTPVGSAPASARGAPRAAKASPKKPRAKGKQSGVDPLESEASWQAFVAASAAAACLPATGEKDVAHARVHIEAGIDVLTERLQRAGAAAHAGSEAEADGPASGAAATPATAALVPALAELPENVLHAVVLVMEAALMARDWTLYQVWKQRAPCWDMASSGADSAGALLARMQNSLPQEVHGVPTVIAAMIMAATGPAGDDSGARGGHEVPPEAGPPCYPLLVGDAFGSAVNYTVSDAMSVAVARSVADVATAGPASAVRQRLLHTAQAALHSAAAAATRAAESVATEAWQIEDGAVGQIRPCPVSEALDSLQQRDPAAAALGSYAESALPAYAAALRAATQTDREAWLAKATPRSGSQVGPGNRATLARLDAARAAEQLLLSVEAGTAGTAAAPSQGAQLGQRWWGGIGATLVGLGHTLTPAGALSTEDVMNVTQWPLHGWTACRELNSSEFAARLVSAAASRPGTRTWVAPILPGPASITEIAVHGRQIAPVQALGAVVAVHRAVPRSRVQAEATDCASSLEAGCLPDFARWRATPELLAAALCAGQASLGDAIGVAAEPAGNEAASAELPAGTNLDVPALNAWVGSGVQSQGLASSSYQVKTDWAWPTNDMRWCVRHLGSVTLPADPTRAIWGAQGRTLACTAGGCTLNVQPAPRKAPRRLVLHRAHGAHVPTGRVWLRWVPHIVDGVTTAAGLPSSAPRLPGAAPVELVARLVPPALGAGWQRTVRGAAALAKWALSHGVDPATLSMAELNTAAAAIRTLKCDKQGSVQLDLAWAHGCKLSASSSGDVHLLCAPVSAVDEAAAWPAGVSLGQRSIVGSAGTVMQACTLPGGVAAQRVMWSNGSSAWVLPPSAWTAALIDIVQPSSAAPAAAEPGTESKVGERAAPPSSARAWLITSATGERTLQVNGCSAWEQLPSAARSYRAKQTEAGAWVAKLPPVPTYKYHAPDTGDSVVIRYEAPPCSHPGAVQHACDVQMEALAVAARRRPVFKKARDVLALAQEQARVASDFDSERLAALGGVLSGAQAGPSDVATHSPAVHSAGGAAARFQAAGAPGMGLHGSRVHPVQLWTHPEVSAARQAAGCAVPGGEVAMWAEPLGPMARVVICTAPDGTRTVLHADGTVHTLLPHCGREREDGQQRRRLVVASPRGPTVEYDQLWHQVAGEHAGGTEPALPAGGGCFTRWVATAPDGTVVACDYDSRITAKASGLLRVFLPGGQMLRLPDNGRARWIVPPDGFSPPARRAHRAAGGGHGDASVELNSSEDSSDGSESAMSQVAGDTSSSSDTDDELGSPPLSVLSSQLSESGDGGKDVVLAELRRDRRAHKRRCVFARDASQRAAGWRVVQVDLKSGATKHHDSAGNQFELSPAGKLSASISGTLQLAGSSTGMLPPLAAPPQPAVFILRADGTAEEWMPGSAWASLRASAVPAERALRRANRIAANASALALSAAARDAGVAAPDGAAQTPHSMPAVPSALVHAAHGFAADGAALPGTAEYASAQNMPASFAPDSRDAVRSGAGSADPTRPATSAVPRGLEALFTMPSEVVSLTQLCPAKYPASVALGSSTLFGAGQHVAAAYGSWAVGGARLPLGLATAGVVSGSSTMQVQVRAGSRGWRAPSASALVQMLKRSRPTREAAFGSGAMPAPASIQAVSDSAAVTALTSAVSGMLRRDGAGAGLGATGGAKRVAQQLIQALMATADADQQDSLDSAGAAAELANALAAATDTSQHARTRVVASIPASVLPLIVPSAAQRAMPVIAMTGVYTVHGAVDAAQVAGLAQAERDVLAWRQELARHARQFEMDEVRTEAEQAVQAAASSEIAALRAGIRGQRRRRRVRRGLSPKGSRITV